MVDKKLVAKVLTIFALCFLGIFLLGFTCGFLYSKDSAASSYAGEVEAELFEEAPKGKNR